MTRHDEQLVANGEKITYWRSMENRRRTEAYVASLHNEFSSDLTDISSFDRRAMLKIMGASIALAGVGVSCRRPEEKILPYVKDPHNFTPGLSQFFATVQPSPFGAQGILVESNEGRPTKVEGNPSHPDSLGKASIFNQAAALEIYDPDRSRYCSEKKPGGHVPAEWAEWDSFASSHFQSLRQKAGAKLAIVLDSDLSPTVLRLKSEIKKVMPEAKFYVHEPMRQSNAEAAAHSAFGGNTRVRYNLGNAKTIACLFADPFSFGPEHLSHLRGFASRRSVHKPSDVAAMNRLYTVEADYGLAGINADHRLRLPLGLAKNFVEALAYELHASHNLDIDKSLPDAQSLSNLVARPPSYKGLDQKFLFAMAKDLARNKGQALILGGNHLAKEVLALIHALNVALLGHKKTFDVLTINDAEAVAHLAEPDILALASSLKEGRVDTLVMIGVNPVYDAPGKLAFAELLPKANTSIHMGLHRDETGELCTWHIPQTHFLEQFGDSRSYDGLVSIVQPLIKPLHDARSGLQLLSAIAGLASSKPLEMVKASFAARFAGPDWQSRFDKAVHDGVVKNSEFASSPLRVRAATIFADFKAHKGRAPNKDNFELLINFDRKVLDGRYTNHSWLQELPDPVTKINWGNALLMSPTAAREYKIKSGVRKNAYMADVVKLSANGQSVELPVFVMPGLSDYTLVATLGYGRKKAGTVGSGVGFDLYGMLADYSNLVQHGVKLELTPKTERISSTQEQFAMNGETVQQVEVLTLQNRDPARTTTTAEYLREPKAAKNRGLLPNLLTKEPGRAEEVPLQITDAWDYSKGNQWGMVIDLAKCTGCNACAVACQSENNIPVVGKEQVIRGRMMQWIRMDRYMVGDVKSPLAIVQPVLCQHCENAPCEPVCPVAATSHDTEGLNVMTYNRCVGTRYCANNCPYKVRRFNYFDYSESGNLYVGKEAEERARTTKLQRNPDVTVRYRGVMEKCTFCTQRIQEAKMLARREGRDQNNLPDRAVTPACAQSCPSEAITFGNINDKNARVTELKNTDRNYTMLDVLNTRPRISYLSRLRNSNPELLG